MRVCARTAGGGNLVKIDADQCRKGRPRKRPVCMSCLLKGPALEALLSFLDICVWGRFRIDLGLGRIEAGLLNYVNWQSMARSSGGNDVLQIANSIDLIFFFFYRLIELQRGLPLDGKFCLFPRRQILLREDLMHAQPASKLPNS